MSILGIELSCNKNDLMSLNYTPVLKRIKNCLNISRQRHLSLFGRIEVIKTLAISRLVYILTLLPAQSKEYFIEIERMLYQFLWRSKPARIRATIIQNKIDSGGAGMTDLKVTNESLKLGWLEGLISCPGDWRTPV